MTNDNLMPAPCLGCGGQTGIKWGRTQRGILDLDGRGQAERTTLSLQRWRCAGCGVVRAEAPMGIRQRSLASISARDAVASACFVSGYANAGIRYGVDEKTARALWDEWASLREGALPQVAPESIGLHAVRAAGVDRTLVVDADALTVVDFLEDTQEEAIRTWLRNHEGWRVQRACISPIASYRTALLSESKDCVLSILPGHARTASLRAWVGSFRFMFRGMHSPGRNVREDVRVFASSNPNPAELDDMQGWSSRIVALRDMKDEFLMVLASGQETRVLRAIALRAIALGGSSLPLRLVDAWGAEMRSGANSNEISYSIDGITELCTSRRPSLCFALLRGLVLLQWNGQGGEIMDWEAEGMEELSSSSKGVPFDQALVFLQS